MDDRHHESPFSCSFYDHTTNKHSKLCYNRGLHGKYQVYFLESDTIVFIVCWNAAHKVRSIVWKLIDEKNRRHSRFVFWLWDICFIMSTLITIIADILTNLLTNSSPVPLFRALRKDSCPRGLEHPVAIPRRKWKLEARKRNFHIWENFWKNNQKF